MADRLLHRWCDIHTHTHTHTRTHTRTHTHTHISFKRALYSHQRAPYSSHRRAFYSIKWALFSCTRDSCHTRTNEGRCTPDYKRKIQNRTSFGASSFVRANSKFKSTKQISNLNAQIPYKEACCLFGSHFVRFAKKKHIKYEACDPRSQIWNCEPLWWSDFKKWSEMFTSLGVTVHNFKTLFLHFVLASGTERLWHR